MKKFTSLLNRTKTFITKEYTTYTLKFFVLMMVLYFCCMFAGMAAAPKFTYAAF